MRGGCAHDSGDVKDPGPHATMRAMLRSFPDGPRLASGFSHREFIMWLEAPSLPFYVAEEGKMGILIKSGCCSLVKKKCYQE